MSDFELDSKTNMELTEKLGEYRRELELNEMLILKKLERFRMKMEEKDKRIKELEDKLAEKQMECFEVNERCKLFEMQLEEVERMTEAPSTVEQGVQVDMDEPKPLDNVFEKGRQEYQGNGGQSGIEGKEKTLLARDALDGHGIQEVKEEDPEDIAISLPSTSTVTDNAMLNSANGWSDSDKNLNRNSMLWNAEFLKEEAPGEHQSGSTDWSTSWPITMETPSLLGGNQGGSPNASQAVKNYGDLQQEMNIFVGTSEINVKEESVVEQGAHEEVQAEESNEYTEEPTNMGYAAIQLNEENMEDVQDYSDVRMANDEVTTSYFQESRGTQPVQENPRTWNKNKRRRRSGRPIGRLLFTCPVKDCSSSYSQFKKLEEHIQFHQETTDLFCDVCQKTFLSKESAMEHIQQRQKNECCQCGKKLSTSCDIRRHLRIHTGEKPFICETCGQGFSMFHSMTRHIELKHNGEEPYSCRFCQQSFVWRHQLEGHELWHTLIPLKCSHCDYTCGDSGNLRRHMRTHIPDEDRFKCSYCGRRCRSRSYLVAHTRIHTGEKPYSCTECGARFAFNSSLKNHMKKHYN